MINLKIRKTYLRLGLEGLITKTVEGTLKYRLPLNPNVDISIVITNDRELLDIPSQSG